MVGRAEQQHVNVVARLQRRRGEHGAQVFLGAEEQGLQVQQRRRRGEGPPRRKAPRAPRSPRPPRPVRPPGPSPGGRPADRRRDVVERVSCPDALPHRPRPASLPLVLPAEGLQTLTSVHVSRARPRQSTPDPGLWTPPSRRGPRTLRPRNVPRVCVHSPFTPSPLKSLGQEERSPGCRPSFVGVKAGEGCDWDNVLRRFPERHRPR